MTCTHRLQGRRAAEETFEGRGAKSHQIFWRSLQRRRDRESKGAQNDTNATPKDPFLEDQGWRRENWLVRIRHNLWRTEINTKQPPRRKKKLHCNASCLVGVMGKAIVDMTSNSEKKCPSTAQQLFFLEWKSLQQMKRILIKLQSYSMFCPSSPPTPLLKFLLCSFTLTFRDVPLQGKNKDTGRIVRLFSASKGFQLWNASPPSSLATKKWEKSLSLSLREGRRRESFQLLSLGRSHCKVTVLDTWAECTYSTIHLATASSVDGKKSCQKLPPR